MTRSYEELTGGLGRAISFRAERHLVRNFLLESAAEIQIQDQICPLYDLSMSGVSFFFDIKEDWIVGVELNVGIRVHGQLVYEGIARIARVEHHQRQMRIGLHLIAGFLDLHEMQRRDDAIALERNMQYGAEDIWRTVPDFYKNILTELVSFVAYHKRVLDRYEVRLQLEEGEFTEAREMLAERSHEIIRDRWFALLQKITDASMGLDKKIKPIVKEYTETLLTPLMMDVPVAHRAYTKPYGYAGDYEVMLYIYRNACEGGTLFGQVFQKLLCNDPLASGVRTRKDLLKKLSIQEEARVRQEGRQDVFRVMNLGCGPAMEVIEFIEDSGKWGGPIQWILIDQEEKALSLALKGVLRKLGPRRGEGQVRCLHLSFEQLVRDPSSIIPSESQDFIYCAGLFDYLSLKRAQALVQALYDRIAPGGLIAIGNALAPNKHAWFTSYVLDWSLIYRTEDDMMEMVKMLSDAMIEVVVEPSNAYHFLLIRKK